MIPDLGRKFSRSYCFSRAPYRRSTSCCGLTRVLVGVLKEDSDDIADAGAQVVAPQGSESQEWGGGVHDAHGASASQAITTMNCSPFQGVAP
ncbi:hypothetical protein VDF74_06590 [Xanthomonas campestris pv. raphani]|uniref:hypothetical protein n=1 Tax=Xanthomonas campestris TaxID=339 RepID=UPI002B23BC57|nr:hypothetical protein [Xanthomonas campestris]MEA9738658.1 hypothetical protein [Xanthomonas campestris pv. raphani]